MCLRFALPFIFFLPPLSLPRDIEERSSPFPPPNPHINLSHQHVSKRFRSTFYINKKTQASPFHRRIDLLKLLLHKYTKKRMKAYVYGIYIEMKKTGGEGARVLIHKSREKDRKKELLEEKERFN